MFQQGAEEGTTFSSSLFPTSSDVKQKVCSLCRYHSSRWLTGNQTVLIFHPIPASAASCTRFTRNSPEGTLVRFGTDTASGSVSQLGAVSRSVVSPRGLAAAAALQVNRIFQLFKKPTGASRSAHRYSLMESFAYQFCKRAPLCDCAGFSGSNHPRRSALTTPTLSGSFHIVDCLISFFFF